MSTYLWVALAWLVLGAVVAVLVGRAIRARDAHVPSGPRVRVEQRRRLEAERQRLLALGVPDKLLRRIDEARTIRPWRVEQRRGQR